jgi:ATP-binding cassette, subfamily B, bacterial
MKKRPSSGDHTAMADMPQGMLSAIASRHRLLIAGVAVASFVGALFEAAFLFLVTTLGVALVEGRDRLDLPLSGSYSSSFVLLIAAITLVVRLALNLISVAASAELAARVTSETRKRIARSYLGASWALQQNEPSGRLQEMLTSFVQRMTDATITLTQVISSALSLAALLVSSLLIEPRATAAVLAALVLVGLFLTPFRGLIRRRSRAHSQSSLAFASSVAELGSLGLEMQVFGARDRFVEVVDELTDLATGQARRVQFLSASLGPLYLAIAYGAILAGVAYLGATRVVDVAVIGAVLILMLRSLSYGQQLSSAAGTLAAARPFLDRVGQSILDYDREPAPQGDRVPPAVVPLSFEGVSFHYGTDRPALTKVSVDIQPGEAIGIVGPSGAGKTTFAQLLLGLLEPDGGHILVSGVELGKVQREWWSSRVAFVPQEARLITGTVAENLRFFRSDISDEALEDAAARANILKEIRQMPAGFETHLGQRGGQLSGGQRQRLAIARALATGPELLVLDEPTSALDGRSELLVRQTIDDLHGSTTVVIIAHRLSTLERCDRIFVFEDGRLTRTGMPGEVSLSSAFFKEALSASQAGSSLGDRTSDPQPPQAASLLDRP